MRCAPLGLPTEVPVIQDAEMLDKPFVQSYQLRKLKEKPESGSDTVICSPPPVVGAAGTRVTMTWPSRQEARPLRCSPAGAALKPLYS